MGDGDQTAPETQTSRHIWTGRQAARLDISVGLARKYFYAMDEQIRQIPPGGLELLKMLGTLREADLAAEVSTNFPK